MGRQIAALVGAFVIVMVFAWAGLSEQLGAHPFWAVKTGWIGGATGAGVALALILTRVSSRLRLVLGVAGLVAGYAVAKTGAARFAASYAEDVLAGRFWFFGWIAVAGALVVTLQALAAWRR
jgi:hypothetical protein